MEWSVNPTSKGQAMAQEIRRFERLRRILKQSRRGLRPWVRWATDWQSHQQSDALEMDQGKLLRLQVGDCPELDALLTKAATTNSGPTVQPPAPVLEEDAACRPRRHAFSGRPGSGHCRRGRRSGRAAARVRGRRPAGEEGQVLVTKAAREAARAARALSLGAPPAEARRRSQKVLTLHGELFTVEGVGVPDGQLEEWNRIDADSAKAIQREVARVLGPSAECPRSLRARAKTVRERLRARARGGGPAAAPAAASASAVCCRSRSSACGSRRRADHGSPRG
ncbi:unnamed protein product [Prorocentrum cordatum]|uniref:Uncharacterized protein n=1 Tax=Prorocentrum cordatum TaxID=2364126 RepID=A0ABN9Y0U9_9DINO|nr:unnamed protein product [Polarella glacialis]